MNKKYVKLLLSLAAIVSALIVMCVSANAFLTGDVNADKVISADDARLILRTAVKLETLTEQQFKIADVNDDGQITANDARLVLRMSVDLEEKTHYYEKEVLTAATCTTGGRVKLTCTECDDVYEKDIDALGHSWNISKPTCTEDKYCKREDCPTNERVSKLGHTTNWGSCNNCKTFITEKYAEQAAVIKASFNEAKAAFDAAYAINNYNAMLDGVSYHTLPNTKAALPNYIKAKTAYETAFAACGDIAEFASIKALLEKNIYNLTISIEEANKIITFCDGNSAKIDATNYDSLVEKLETHNAGFWNSSYKDHTVGNNKKLVAEIKW